MYDVITMGSATVDVRLTVESELIKITTPEHTDTLIAYPLGTKLIIQDLVFTVGGGGTNCAVAFARLGLKVGWLGMLGDDEHGHLVRRILKQEGIDVLGAVSKTRKTGYSVILDSLEGDRTILTFKGCNDYLLPGLIDTKKLRARHFYFASMMGDSWKGMEAVAAYAKKKAIPMTFNPSSYLAKLGTKHISKVLDATTNLILNKEEAALLVGDGPVKDLLTRLHALDHSAVCITDGKAGSYAYDGKSFWKCKASKNVKVVEATGAGDAFAATFTAARLLAKPIPTAMQWGTANAQSVIQHKGAKELLLNRRQLMAALRNIPVRTSAL
ncbi:hypothetical protein AUJ68_06855 [Candidatus Woesearchaeota archaeon CG1_02_57_44]|nr:MAG: hypothetical protein AUJ68_06855 [Candidatus Woesearchaeota archaeon CG1_02_57_44]